MADRENGPDWQMVVARSAAFLALHGSGLREKDLATQGQFLERLGLPRRDAAELLGTTPASLTELLGRARRKKGAGRGRSKKK
jgi:CRP-like cAMP-binding protein